jgi:hypothetical protein
MGLDKFYSSGMVGINLRMKQCFLEGWDVHKTLRSMSNAKVQISNGIKSLNLEY